MGYHNNWNLNVLCVDSDEDILKLYQDVLTSKNRTMTVTKKYTESSYDTPEIENKYCVFPAMSGQAASRIALEAKHQGRELAVGFFDIGINGEINGLESIIEIKRIFPITILIYHLFSRILTEHYISYTNGPN